MLKGLNLELSFSLDVKKCVLFSLLFNIFAMLHETDKKIHLKKILIWPFSLEFSNQENELLNIKFLVLKKLRKFNLCEVLYAKNFRKPVPKKYPKKYKNRIKRSNFYFKFAGYLAEIYILECLNIELYK